MTSRPLWYRAALACYGGGMSVATWGALVPWHLARSAAAGAAVGDLPARLGRVSPAGVGGEAPIVVHAVSLGELQAARALIDAMAASAPAVPVVLTCGTADALRVARGVRPSMPSVVAVTPLPWDRVGATRRWLARMRPRALVLVETELWPGLLDACGMAGIPVAIVSGRVSARDARRYERVRPFLGRALASVRIACVQDAEMHRRFVRIGIDAANVIVNGDLKVDARPSAPVHALAVARPLVVAGSIRASEESFVLEAWRTVRKGEATARLALVPRHVARARRLQRALARDGHRVVPWEDARHRGLDAGATTVVDAPGFLAALYASCDVAVVGGSFARTGAHNVYEAARGGAAMIVGPQPGAMRAPIDELDARGALTRVWEPSGSALGLATLRLLSDAGRRAACASAARAWLAERSGAAARTAMHLLTTIEADRGRRSATWPSREDASRSRPRPSAGT